MGQEQEPIQPWSTLQSKNVLQNKWITVRQDSCKLPDESVIDDYFVVERADIAGVVALTPEQEVICNVQYKHGIQEIVREIPAGIIEPGETPEQGAIRELEEETGYTTDALVHLKTVIVSPTSQNNRYHIYLATDARPCDRKLDTPRETIHNELIPLQQVKQMIETGEFPVMWSVASLYFAFEWLEKNK